MFPFRGSVCLCVAKAPLEGPYGRCNQAAWGRVWWQSFGLLLPGFEKDDLVFCGLRAFCAFATLAMGASSDGVSDVRALRAADGWCCARASHLVVRRVGGVVAVVLGALGNNWVCYSRIPFAPIFFLLPLLLSSRPPVWQFASALIPLVPEIGGRPLLFFFFFPFCALGAVCR